MAAPRHDLRPGGSPGESPGNLGWRGQLLLLITVACVLAAIALPAMPQPLSYHEFADCRSLFGVANFFNVISNLPFLVAGAWGLILIFRGRGRVHRSARATALPGVLPRRLAHLPRFGLLPRGARQCAAGLGSSADDTGFRGPGRRGDRRAHRLPGSACARCGHCWRWACSRCMFWYGTERAGAGNVMPYGVYQGWSVLVIVLVLIWFPATRYSHGSLLGLGRHLVRPGQGVRDLRPADLPPARRHGQRPHRSNTCWPSSRCSPSCGSCSCASR